MNYEWDEAKRLENIRKHGVDFADAIGVLEDLRNLTLADEDAIGESRYRTLGMDVQLRILLVVWTERAVDRIRIISARQASPGEARHYPE